METSLYHLEIVVAPENLAFYRDLLPFLGWKTLHDSDEVVGYGSSSGASLWFTPRANGAQNDYDGAGMNHLGFGASSQAEVDEVAAWAAQCAATADLPHASTPLTEIDVELQRSMTTRLFRS